MYSGAHKPPAQGASNGNCCRKLTGQWLSVGLEQAISTRGTEHGSVSNHGRLESLLIRPTPFCFVLRGAQSESHWVAIHPCVDGYSRTFKEGAETPTALSGRRQGESRLLAPLYDGIVLWTVTHYELFWQWMIIGGHLRRVGRNSMDLWGSCQDPTRSVGSPWMTRSSATGTFLEVVEYPACIDNG
jgi:hypothetical protein